MIKRYLLLTGIISLLMFTLNNAYAEESNPDKKKLEVKKDFSGYGGIVGGQIIRGLGSMGVINHAWLQNCYLGLKLDATINERVRVIFNGEFHLNFSYNVDATYIGKDFYGDMFSGAYRLYIKETHGIFTLGDLEFYPLQIHAGKFPYTYNPQVRNLGEYLFRGSAYPTYMYNLFDDSSSAPIMGIMLSTHPWKFFTLDAMLSSETQKYPLQDWSLAGVASFAIGEFVEFGGGLCFDRIFPKDDQFTNPVNEKNLYMEFETDSARDGNGDAIFDFDPFANELIARMDTTVQDSFYYTFQSIKAVVRLNLNPKAFFKTTIFGEEDLKIYSEIGFLGLKDYKGYYGALHQRMPIMVGFNVPTFKLLDVLSFEMEFFNNPYIPGFRRCFREGNPAPKDDQGESANFYWSVYAKRSIGGFAFVTQFARDHIRPNNNNMWFDERDDVLVTKRDWWWAFKIHYGF